MKLFDTLIMELERFKRVSFNVRDFSKNDAGAIIAGIKSESHKYRLAKLFKLFLYFLLMKEEEKFYVKLEHSLNNGNDDFDSQKEWQKLKLMKKRFDQALKHDIASKAPKVSKDQRRKKVFATRGQLVSCINTVLRNQVPRTQRLGIQRHEDTSEERYDSNDRFFRRYSSN